MDRISDSGSDDLGSIPNGGTELESSSFEEDSNFLFPCNVLVPWKIMLVVGSIIFAVKLDFFGKNRTKEHNLHIGRGWTEEHSKISYDVERVVQLVFDFHFFVEPQRFNLIFKPSFVCLVTFDVPCLFGFGNFSIEIKVINTVYPTVDVVEFKFEIVCLLLILFNRIPSDIVKNLVV